VNYRRAAGMSLIMNLVVCASAFGQMIEVSGRVDLAKQARHSRASPCEFGEPIPLPRRMGQGRYFARGPARRPSWFSRSRDTGESPNRPWPLDHSM